MYTYRITRIAVALDGSNLSEMTIPFAVHLAQLLKAELLLLQVSLWPENLHDSVYQDREVRVTQVAYLNKLKRNLTDLNKEWKLAPEQVLIKLCYKKSVFELGKIASGEGAGLLIITTHGRSGLSLLVMGSMATSVIKHTN